MRIHHLDCGPMRPFGGALMDGVSPGAVGRLTCHCLAIETDGEGLVLVDTGLGLRDMLRPYPRLPLVNAGVLRFRFDPDRTALRHIKRMQLPACPAHREQVEAGWPAPVLHISYRCRLEPISN